MLESLELSQLESEAIAEAVAKTKKNSAKGNGVTANKTKNEK